MAQARKKAPKTVSTPSRLSHHLRESAFLLSVLVAVYLVACLFTYHPTDPGPFSTTNSDIVQNAGRILGAWIADAFLGLMGFFTAGIHAFCSFILLNPAYYSKFFAMGGRLNVVGEMSMTFGVLALFLLLGPAITTLPMMAKALGGVRWKRNQRLGYVTLGLVAIHLVVMGWSGWMSPSGWHGGMPPISLLAFIIAVIPVFIKKKLDHERNLHE